MVWSGAGCFHEILLFKVACPSRALPALLISVLTPASGGSWNKAPLAEDKASEALALANKETLAL